MDGPNRPFEGLTNDAAARTPVAKRMHRATELTVLSSKGFTVGATLAWQLAKYIDGADTSFKDKGKGVERPAFAIYKGTDIVVRVGEGLIDICVPPGFASVVYKGAATDRCALMKKLLRHQ